MTSESPQPQQPPSITEAAEARSPSLRGLIRDRYDELLALAQKIHAEQGPGAVHSPVSLVHEAFLRLVHQPKITAGGKLFFEACVAQEYRRIQIDAIRRRQAGKRGGGVRHESVADQSGLSTTGTLDLFEIDEAMQDLAHLDPELAQIADLKLFGGFTIEQCAEVTGCSPRTVDSAWALARSWLQRRLG